MLYAIPNGGSRGDSAKSRAIQGARMKATGTKRGVPDTFLAVARRDYHGLYIELKRPKSERGAKGRVAETQNEWHNKLRMEGYAVFTCYGWEEAVTLLNNYLEDDR